MKALIPMFTLITILFFTSCTKDSFLNDDLTPKTEQTAELNSSRGNGQSLDTDTQTTAFTETKDIAVTTMSSSQTASELTVDFTANHDFSTAVLINTQHIVFVDGNGNETTISLNVNSYTGGAGTLQVTFATSGASLGGLDLKDAQFIVIEEEIWE